MVKGFRLCPPQQAIVTAIDTDQVGIVQFKVFINKYLGAPWTTGVNLEDSFQLTKEDTIFYMCHKDSFTIDPFTGKKVYNWCFMYPDFTKGKKVVASEWAQLNAMGYFAKDTFAQLKLTDSLFLKLPSAPFIDPIEHEYSMWQPGKYQLISSIRNVYGCAGMAATRLFVGHYTDFAADDTIICYEGGGDTVTFQHFVRYFWLKIFPTDPDLNPNEYWVDPTNKLGMHDPAFGARTGPPQAPAVIEKVEWDFGDGSGYHLHNNLTDTIKWGFNTPGDYDITMRTTDSNGCVQLLTRKAFIKVIGVVAKFDTSGGVDVCAPQAVDFLDKSFGLNVWKYIYDNNGNKKDSIKIDSVVKWWWAFGDQLGTSSRSRLQNPTHTYITNGTYDVNLIIEATNGCRDTVDMPEFVHIQGPIPKIWLFENGKYTDSVGGCDPHTVVVKDYSTDLRKWEFNLGNGSPNQSFTPKDLSSDTTFTLKYDNPGVYNLVLTAINDSVYSNAINAYVQCKAVYGDTIVNPNSPLFTVTVLPVMRSRFSGDTLICSGDEANFMDESDTGYKEMIWEWGDGSPYYTSTAGNDVTHKYDNPVGTVDTVYTVEMDGQGYVCPDKIKSMQIRVQDAIAGAEVRETNLPIIAFGNTSIGADPTLYKWTIEGITADGENINLDYFHEQQMGGDTGVYVHDFGNVKGQFKVCMWVWIDGLGCEDTSCVIVENTFETKLEMPNVFTPNGDGVNDFFEPIEYQGVEKWQLVVYNRWGQKVFETDRVDDFWDGRKMNDGSMCAPDVYYYVLTYQLRGEKEDNMSGTVDIKIEN